MVAVDRYKNAPAHLVANRAYTINMQYEATVMSLSGHEQSIAKSTALLENLILLPKVLMIIKPFGLDK